MAVHLHRAPRADLLVERLAGLLATPLPDPFAAELVLVPAKGVERWLSQRLSHHLGAVDGDGVCAGVDLRSPRSLVAEVVGGARDAWSVEELVWPLLETVDACLDEPWARVLSLHLGGPGAVGDVDDLRRGRRYAVAQRLARLFVSYASQRPALLRAWEAGEDADGAGGRVPPDLAWQPELWRRLVSARGLESPGARHEATLARLRADPEAVALPERLSLFGHTRLPVTEIELLGAVATHRDVHLWLPHPSPELWEALAAESAGPVRRRDDESHRVVRHPLLGSLGRDVRELQRGLAVLGATGDVASDDDLGPGNLLHWLQDDLRHNRAPDPSGREFSVDDTSLLVHACHGAARQVQVLREVVLGLLEDDPTLEPRDIVVMCPDIEAFAPLLQAAFGLGQMGGTSPERAAETHPGHRLEIRLADRALIQTNPLLGVVGQLLDLAGGRAEASRVLDLMAAEPVRRRFGLTEEHLDTITRWVRDSGVRWAFDAAHRREFGLDAFVQNTWQFGLDRVLAGVAVSDDAHAYFGQTLPLDDVGSSEIEVAGVLAEVVDRLRDVTDRLTGSHPADHWLRALTDGVEGLTSVAPSEEWQRAQVRRELAALGESVGDVELRLSDVRALMRERLAGRPTRANFRTGTLTVCTLTPMRSVPHRVVCLLGLDDGVFPRSGTADGDDVLSRDALTGERDPRSEDRQLLLDALLAATERVVVTYSGADEVSGLQRPPSVPLQELVDVLGRTATGVDVVRRHPLQAFDSRNLQRSGGRPPLSFDRAALRGAVAAAGPRSRPAQLRDLELPPSQEEEVELDRLLDFLRSPVKEFLRRRLDIAVPAEDDDIADQMPVDATGLVGWGVGQRILDDLVRGTDVTQALQTEWRRGELPPGRLGWAEARAVAEKAVPLAEQMSSMTRGLEPSAFDVDVELPDGRRLVGTVSDLYGDRVIQAGYSALRAKQIVTAWATSLVAGAARPGRGYTVGAIGRGSRSRPTARMVYAEQPDALAQLAALVEIYDAGMRGPLPLPIKSAHRWAEVRRGGRARSESQQRAWSDRWTDSTFPGESSEPAHRLVYGGLEFADLLRLKPRAGEEYDGESSRLGALAMRVFGPALERGIPG